MKQYKMTHRILAVTAIIGLSFILSACAVRAARKIAEHAQSSDQTTQTTTNSATQTEHPSAS